ncbi:hypothetical protein K435DRAFT_864118 [Dendrothele bispora CBS 962.96]|uniref:HTH CENPB-type domain-containing protein n=1 Tax=Dendrothele bispora (strain CBS 962.96) TaxID=1314807 RepID=A0A4V4HEC9_DENBC|nr:hypothetical protein K435DRAFT_864118 [Dendrothele bispora CBS 962.96]
MPVEQTVKQCAPRPKPNHEIYEKRRKRGPTTKTHRTAAVTTDSEKKKNLTLGNKLQIIQYMNDHPTSTQQQVCDYFCTRSDSLGGKLFFNQSTISHIWVQKEELLERATSILNALSMTHACVVTNSNVDTALFCWVKYFNLEKGEVASGLMLQAKRTYFENQFNVPENERLQGPGWVQSFCKAYNISELR